MFIPVYPEPDITLIVDVTDPLNSRIVKVLVDCHCGHRVDRALVDEVAGLRTCRVCADAYYSTIIDAFEQEMGHDQTLPPLPEDYM